MAKALDESSVREALSDFADPETGRSIVETGQLREIKTDAGSLSVTLGLSTHSGILRQEVRDRLLARLKEGFPEAGQVSVHLVVHERPAEKIGQIGLAAKSVIAVGSGKGGVGKSTV